MANETVGHIECPLCGAPDAAVRLSKSTKPYILCEECGFQGFARQGRAVGALKAKMRAVAAAAVPVAADPAPVPAPEQEKTIFDYIGGWK